MSGVAVEVSDLSLRLGAFRLRNIGLDLAGGEVLVILGPNGAGKSLTLEAIAGFRPLTAGRITLGGRDLTALPPERRRIALLFQEFGLFPHLTVRDNIAFANRGRAHPRRPGRDPSRLLAEFDVAGLAARYPHELSLGQKQRVAIARALAADPELILLDEPFSAVDLPTRDLLRAELGRFLREAGLPAIFVTHDRSDAGSLADKVAVLYGGGIIQYGGAAEVFEQPHSGLVAEIVGIENVLTGRVVGCCDGATMLALGDRVLHAAAAPPAGEVAVCIRAEDVVLRADPANGGSANRLAGRILAIANLGPYHRVSLDCGFPLVAHLTRRRLRETGLVAGDRAVAEIDPAAIHLARTAPIARNGNGAG